MPRPRMSSAMNWRGTPTCWGVRDREVLSARLTMLVAGLPPEQVRGPHRTNVRLELPQFNTA
jgi:hypothetical protein